MATQLGPSDIVSTPENLDNINKGLAQLDTAARELELARRAGVDTQGMEANVADIKAKLLKAKQVYFPGQP